MQKYLVNSVGFSRNDATLISAGTLVLFMFMQPVFGALSDRIGRRPVLMFFGILGTLCTVPIMLLLQSIASFWAAFGLVTFALFILCGYTSINAVVKAELFPVQIRAIGVGLPYAFTQSVFGGTVEYVGLWFKSIGMESGFFWYIAAGIGCSLLVYFFMQDTRNTSLIDRD